MKTMPHYQNEGEKIHTIISFDAEKAFENIQHLFMMKTFNKLGVERNFLTMIKGIYKNLAANILLNGQGYTLFFGGGIQGLIEPSPRQ